jgi:signal transduction histidine kinase
VDVTSADASDEVIISIRNVSEKQRLLEKLLDDYEQTKALTQARDCFITNLSGDLTSPLNSIIGFSQALFEGLGGELTEKQKKYLGIINTNGKKLLDMMEEIIDITALDANKKEFTFKNFDIIKMVDFAIETIKPLCAEKKIELITDYSTLERRNCNCDELALRKILLNIFDNAVKFTDAGSIQISLSHPELDFVSYHGIKVPAGYSEKSFIHFTVKDTGIGIQESELDSVFDEYRILDKSVRQKYGGTGLSLAITRKTTEKLDGVIWVESELIEGSEFHIIIPIERIRFSDLEN